MRTILEVYFGVNILIAGYYLGEDFGFGYHGIFRSICLLFFKLLFGCVYYPTAIIWSLISIAFTWIINKIDKDQILIFYLNFYFTRIYNKFPEEGLEHLNRVILPKHTTDSRLDGHWRNAIRLINKRNKYVYIEKDKEQHER